MCIDYIIDYIKGKYIITRSRTPEYIYAEVSPVVAKAATATAESNYRLCPTCREPYVKILRNQILEEGPGFVKAFPALAGRSKVRGRIILCRSCQTVVLRLTLEGTVMYFSDCLEWRLL